MVLNDPLLNAMSTMKNAEKVGKSECKINPASKMIGDVLKVMQKEKYIGEFEFVDNGKSGHYNVKLLGKINNCGVIKPRLAVKRESYEEYENRFLPAENMGVLVVSTSYGVMTQREATTRKVGGRLLAFVY
ncbi:MAG: 30S ribosomal protein S8 [Candidatus Diapherotrites archaeon]|nr:30S ribosomal protein S8 [Candidatus Diapherotrites archaeon]